VVELELGLAAGRAAGTNADAIRAHAVAKLQTFMSKQAGTNKKRTEASSDSSGDSRLENQGLAAADAGATCRLLFTRATPGTVAATSPALRFTSGFST
jgi:hypothetical protein